MTLALPARAKLNLDLRVGALRADGYHDIETTLQAIDVHDLLLASRAPATSLHVQGLHVPPGHENLVLRAVAALEEASGVSLPTQFTLFKRVPAGAGLGGGSSDAAAALRAAAALYRLEVELAPVAAQLGADVPFFLQGGRARAAGRGDELIPLEFIPSWFAIAWPGFELSTSAVYQAAEHVSTGEANQLTEAALSVEPSLGDFRERLGQGWQMTGAGSAFFLPAADRRAAQAAIAELDCWTAIARAVPAWG